MILDTELKERIQAFKKEKKAKKTEMVGGEMDTTEG